MADRPVERSLAPEAKVQESPRRLNVLDLLTIAAVLVGLSFMLQILLEKQGRGDMASLNWLRATASRIAPNAFVKPSPESQDEVRLTAEVGQAASSDPRLEALSKDKSVAGKALRSGRRASRHPSVKFAARKAPHRSLVSSQQPEDVALNENEPDTPEIR